MTIKQILDSATNIISGKSITSARLDAEVLLAHVLDTPREYLIAHWEAPVRQSAVKKYAALVARRCRYEPVAYLLGHKDFYGLRLKVDQRVLIPRPETEQLVDEVIALVSLAGTKPLIFDVGTGSGAIALALAKNLPQASVVALEASPNALKLAKINASRLRLKISFIKSDLLSAIKAEQLAGSIIVANLPYLDRSETPGYELEVKRGLKFEPQTALYATQKGTAIYAKLFRQIKALPQPPRALAVEIGSHNWRDFLKLAKSHFPKARIQAKNDLTRHKRFLTIVF